MAVLLSIVNRIATISFIVTLNAKRFESTSSFKMQSNLTLEHQDILNDLFDLGDNSADVQSRLSDNCEGILNDLLTPSDNEQSPPATPLRIPTRSLGKETNGTLRRRKSNPELIDQSLIDEMKSNRHFVGNGTPPLDNEPSWINRPLRVPTYSLGKETSPNLGRRKSNPDPINQAFIDKMKANRNVIANEFIETIPSGSGHAQPAPPIQIPTFSAGKETNSNLRRRKSNPDPIDQAFIDKMKAKRYQQEQECQLISMDHKKSREKLGMDKQKDRVSLFRLCMFSFALCLLIFTATRSVQHHDGGRKLIRKRHGTNMLKANSSPKSADDLTDQNNSALFEKGSKSNADSKLNSQERYVKSTHQDDKGKIPNAKSSDADSGLNIPKTSDRATYQENQATRQDLKQSNTDAALGNFETNAKSADNDSVAIHLKCPFFGCTITAPEASQLDNANSTNAISPKHFLLTHKSHRKVPPVNQDRAMLISPFVFEDAENPNVKNAASSASDNFLMGVFDGHDNAGGDVAQHSMAEIPLHIAQKLRHELERSESADAIDSERVKEAIIHAHEETNDSLPAKLSTMGGCTANIILRLGTTLYMSNVGDSYSYLVTYSTVKNEFHNYKKVNNDLQHHLQGSLMIHHVNTRHKPHLPDESSRILSLGGRVHIPEPPKSAMGSRVIIKNGLKRDSNDDRVGLTMSRSIGDLEFTKIGVIPTPDIIVIDLKELFEGLDEKSKVFVVVASDGLFDHRNMEFVTDYFAHLLYESGSDPNLMLEGMKKLIAAASSLESDLYQDDISFVVKAIEL